MGDVSKTAFLLTASSFYLIFGSGGSTFTSSMTFYSTFWSIMTIGLIGIYYLVNFSLMTRLSTIFIL